MKNKKIYLTAFILVAIAQLYVPAKMIISREEILDSGKEFSFKTAPIDPTDPIRGKYISLRFDQKMIEVKRESDWDKGEPVYAILTTDNDGFAVVKSITKEIPEVDIDYLKAEISFVTEDSSNEVTISYPFDRYYMEETKAYDAELAYSESQMDTNQIAYALVSIKEGEAVLKDVLINGISIKEIVDKRKENQK